MGRQRNWTPEEFQYLGDNWGIKSMPSLMATLNRSKSAILIKVQRLGLGAFLENGDYITFNQLLGALGLSGSYGYKNISWIENRDFPVKYKTVGDCKFKIVYLKDFWKWAEQNRSFVDFSRMEENILGVEPLWLKEQRNHDLLLSQKFTTAPWTTADDNLLKDLLKTYRYGYAELSKRLRRTTGAIQRRICDLGLKERPIKADNHISWTDEEFTLLAELIKKGTPYELIADRLGKSSKAIRGKVYTVYLTENLDKVRFYIGRGTWGNGRPERPISKWNCLTVKEKEDTKNQLSVLAGQLKAILKSKYDENDFWQKDLCIHWNGCCTANETNCDSCTSFVRIKEQYCIRCGATFLNREQSKICPRCIKARKAQHFRKMRKLGRKECSDEETI